MKRLAGTSESRFCWTAFTPASVGKTHRGGGQKTANLTTGTIARTPPRGVLGGQSSPGISSPVCASSACHSSPCQWPPVSCYGDEDADNGKENVARSFISQYRDLLQSVQTLLPKGHRVRFDSQRGWAFHSHPRLGCLCQGQRN